MVACRALRFAMVARMKSPKLSILVVYIVPKSSLFVVADKTLPSDGQWALIVDAMKSGVAKSAEVEADLLKGWVRLAAEVNALTPGARKSPEEWGKVSYLTPRGHSRTRSTHRIRLSLCAVLERPARPCP